MPLVERRERVAVAGDHRLHERGVLGIVVPGAHLPANLSRRPNGVVKGAVSLRDAVRAQTTERTWSQGVALARDGRVSGRGIPGELEVRVPGRPTPFEVVLDEAAGEWQCDCPS